MGRSGPQPHRDKVMSAARIVFWHHLLAPLRRSVKKVFVFVINRFIAALRTLSSLAFRLACTFCDIHQKHWSNMSSAQVLKVRIAGRAWAAFLASLVFSSV